MALAKLNTFALIGIDALVVEAEVDVGETGLPTTILVGLAETSVKESIHRVERAILNSGYRKPSSRTIINLAPADLKKDATAFDLPIALGMLAGTGQLSPECCNGLAVVGELALDGSTRPIRGALGMALAARRAGFRRLLVPAENAREAAVVEDIEVFSVASLVEAVGLVTGELEQEPVSVDIGELFATEAKYEVDFSDVRGQEAAKRALVIAAAGRHNVLLIGPPGTGKTMLAKRLPTIMPPLSLEESLETTQIYSAIGKTSSRSPLQTTRPFRSPHHTASEVGLIGGGSFPQPGEVSLSHHGVLFLDEFPEFSRRTLEVMRQPLEDGRISIARVAAKLSFPADFLLVAAMNPCPCGYAADPRKDCKCSPQMIERYVSKISGPLLDRIDIHLEVPSIPIEDLRIAGPSGSNTADMRRQVEQAREIQRRRFGDSPTGLNGRMNGRQIRKHCCLDAQAEHLLRSAVEHMGLSIRAHDRVLRLARTIADLDASEGIRQHHLAEAIQLRRLDRQV